ncbi:peptidase M14 [Pararhizobium haloflavum]|uniref:peptidase M14 n=1 Tax=Pararhizobium haloflavum TaxID=2037914 RepID=UPI000C1981EA|nr:peptidase M14 [Pararhizobium haloflavum]
MTLITDRSFERTIDTLIADYGRPEHKGACLEAWVFEDHDNRRRAEKSLLDRGVTARIRSAYKPLLHFFLEDVVLADIGQATVRYPVLDGMANRFLLESYPLAALLPDGAIVFEPGTDADFHYAVDIVDKNGTLSSHRVFAPNRRHVDPVGQDCVSPTGWVRLTDAGGSVCQAAYPTDFEAVFAAAVKVVGEREWGLAEPYFDELNIRVELPGKDLPLAHGHESISLHEALHEDLYFTLLEVFQKRSGRPLGDRGLRPGQIVPEIVAGEGAPRLIIETRPLDTNPRTMPHVSLDDAPHALSVSQIDEALAAVAGTPLTATSRAGRPVHARHIAGSDAAVMISGGQHANETSGIVGALRAALQLKDRAGAHFVVSPLENPDGYALHGRLTREHAAQMHHAARYTAFGNDLEFEPDGDDGAPHFERAIRSKAEAISGARLHVNLHGYPAHEWTRPLSGYVPRGFEMWTVPKGFFLIMRHHPEWDAAARVLIDKVTAHLQTLPGLSAFNASQIALFEKHAGVTGFEIINGFPCLISVETRHTAPLTLITEYPDETIEGHAFVDAHTAQMQTVLAAYEAYQTLATA